jgi:hypothetical protein
LSGDQIAGVVGITRDFDMQTGSWSLDLFATDTGPEALENTTGRSAGEARQVTR